MTHHMSIGMSPFYALYGYHPLSFVDMMFGVSRAPRAKIWIQESQDILRALKDNIATAQNQQKLYADKGRVERHFEVGNLVYPGPLLATGTAALWADSGRSSSD